MNVLYLFGPSMGALGQRDPDTYGSQTLAEIMEEVDRRAGDLGHTVAWKQSDHEGDLISWLLSAPSEGVDAVVLNPGALAHQSYALRDAVEACSAPVIEVHMSNIHAREPFRHHSVIGEIAKGQIAGFGVDSYLLGLRAAVSAVGVQKA